MRLTFENFFSHLIFYPCEADTKIDRAIALVASIACGIFSIGICHAVCAIRNFFTHRPSDQATDQDQRIFGLRNLALDIQSSEETDVQAKKPKIQTNIKVTIPSEVKTTLDQLFEGSSYSIDNLPVYPIIINNHHATPERKKMTAPVMKGMCDDGRAFIMMKVDCDLKDQDIERHSSYEEIQNYYKTNRQLEDVLILFQYRKTDPLMWDQLGRGRPMHPSFFTWNFTYSEDGTGPTNSQKENFKLVQTLLKTGESNDTNGLIWRISLT